LNTIRLKFLGAVGTVTGSCTLIEYNKTHYYLVDAGEYINEGNEKYIEIREKSLKKS
jgi:Cft2 family RNA processing exonuclease